MKVYVIERRRLKSKRVKDQNSKIILKFNFKMSWLFGGKKTDSNSPMQMQSLRDDAAQVEADR